MAERQKSKKVVTFGEVMCCLCPPDGLRVEQGEYTPYEIHAMVDRVGGGDAFSGALIFALNSGEFTDEQAALNFATAASCLAHSISGDYNFATREEVNRLVAGNGNGRVRR